LKEISPVNALGDIQKTPIKNKEKRNIIDKAVDKRPELSYINIKKGKI
tara:strand:+ start:354 stop:497 length:144 start_codon:yes stop_codon:yes gene_type:complete